LSYEALFHMDLAS